MSCGGGSFTPDGVYDSLWESVKPKMEVLPKGVLTPGIGSVGSGSSPNLAMDHTLKLTTPIDVTGRAIHQE